MYFLHQSNPPPLHHHHLLLIIISILFFFAFQNPRSCQAQVEFFEFFCNVSSANYDSGRQFETNLKTLLIPALLSNGPSTGYFNFTAGNNTDTVYGLVQCRGDISKENCSSCLNAISVDGIQNCRNKLDATIREETCLLRYSNVNFFSQADYTDLLALYRNETVSDQSAFNRTLGDLLDKLVTDANSTPPPNFKADSMSYGESSNVYGLVECTQDLSATDCLSCLRALVSYIPTDTDMYGKRGGRVSSRSCVLTYADFRFYDQLPLSPSPPPSQVPASPLPSTNVGFTVGPIVARVLTLIALCVCYITI